MNEKEKEMNSMSARPTQGFVENRNSREEVMTIPLTLTSHRSLASSLEQYNIYQHNKKNSPSLMTTAGAGGGNRFQSLQPCLKWE